MIIERPSAGRGRVDDGGLDSRHTFSFGHYHDPQWMGFGPLRVINEDRLQPGAGFAPHRHANMEIISVVIAGALAHADTTGNEKLLRPGEVQWMSAGHGIEHSEYNGDPSAVTHFLQIWIQPDRVNAAPAYAQQAFPRSARIARWVTFVSPDGADGSIGIRQQAWMRGSVLPAGERITATLDPARRYWLQVVAGDVTAHGIRLTAGDALGFVDEEGELAIHADVGEGNEAELLLFDLPR